MRASDGAGDADPRGNRGGDPEQVLSQALRAMAGGGRRADQPAGDRRDGAGGGRNAAAGNGAADADGGRSGGSSWWARLTGTQVVLVALIVGLVIGMAAGIVVLLTR